SWAGVPSRKGRNRRRRLSFFSPKRALSANVSAPASTASRQRSSTSPSGYTTFPCWRGSGRSVKYSRKTPPSLNAPHSSGRPSIAAPRCESEEHHRFSDWGCCHAFLHPIALPATHFLLDQSDPLKIRFSWQGYFRGKSLCPISRSHRLPRFLASGSCS